MKYLLTLFFYTTCSILSAQLYETEFIRSSSLEADIFVGSDDFNNIYFIIDNTFFKKTETDILNYSNISLGEITSIDIQNPFKIILFYASFNTVIILDNKLNPLTDKIDLTKNSLFNNTILVSSSSENNIWLFADDNKMHLYDYKNNSESYQTQALTFYQTNFTPLSLTSDYKNVLLLANIGVFQINQYGNFINFFALNNIDFISSFKNGFIYFKNNSFYFYNKTDSYPILDKLNYTVKNIHINKSTLTIFDGEKIYQYSIL